ncbi:hypothetical protein [Streptomyces sp. NPDC087538]|uniref:hypothetical protein n=1 Tax=Streptomyces sp. NPDC087538 TaxID=3365797 RepID=UPI0037FA636E
MRESLFPSHLPADHATFPAYIPVEDQMRSLAELAPPSLPTGGGPYEPTAPGYDVCPLTPVLRPLAMRRQRPDATPYEFVFFDGDGWVWRARSVRAAVNAARNNAFQHWSTNFSHTIQYFAVWDHKDDRYTATAPAPHTPRKFAGVTPSWAPSAAVMLAQGVLYRLPQRILGEVRPVYGDE